MKLRTFLLGVSALLIAIAAAFFSVTGLSKLFAGASLAVMLMAGSLEFGKLIAASFLYAYWDKINVFLRTYLVIGVVVLIFITSLGIYGFLTSAYQTTADELSVIDKQVQVVDLRKERLQEQLNGFVLERQNLSNSINELTKGLSNNVIQYRDESGQLITTTSSATRRTLENQLNDSKQQRDVVSKRIEDLTQQVTDLDLEILSIQQSSEVAGEVGPLKFMAEVSGLPMSTIINFFALLIVFVFDPLAVTLVIAFNTALKVDKGEEDKKKLDDKHYQLYNDEKSGLYNDTIEKFEKENLLFDYEVNNDVSYEESQDEPDLNDMKQEFDEADYDKDGIVSEEERRKWYEEGGWKTPYNGNPYYMHPWFDWNKKDRWINDRKAIDYWLKFQGGSQRALKEIKTNYPTDFESKTY
jgi:gas vesicle protein